MIYLLVIEQYLYLVTKTNINFFHEYIFIVLNTVIFGEVMPDKAHRINIF